MQKQMGSSKPMKAKTSEKGYDQQKSKLPNFDFHDKKLGCVMRDIHYHIQNWENYKAESREIQKFYEDLEYDHSFIQWIFPNFFNSMFNSDSYRLTKEERDLMISNQDVMKFYVKNYKMFLRFLGIKWGNKELELENEKQFYKCLRINTHNQLRLKRVFASLSVLGQREEALKLLKLVYEKDNQLYGTQYYLYDHLKDEKNNDRQDDIEQETQFGNQQIESTQLQKATQKMMKSDQQKEDQSQIKKEIKNPENQEQKIEVDEDKNENPETNLNDSSQIQQIEAVQAEPEQNSKLTQSKFSNKQEEFPEQKIEQQQINKEIDNTEKQQQNIEEKQDDIDRISNNQNQNQQPNAQENVVVKNDNELKNQEQIPISQQHQEKIDSKKIEINHKEKDDDFQEFHLVENPQNMNSQSKTDSNITTQKQGYENKSSSNTQFQSNSWNDNKPQKQPKGKYEKYEDKKYFNDVKSNYVQGDLLNQSWVKVDLLQGPQK